jgi:hypothetical protein
MNIPHRSTSHFKGLRRERRNASSVDYNDPPKVSQRLSYLRTSKIHNVFEINDKLHQPTNPLSDGALNEIGVDEETEFRKLEPYYFRPTKPR